MPTCLFCRGDGPFTTSEHIVPESLGNDEDILDGAVCDSCQGYFGRSVERPCLDHTPFGYWRTLLGIRTKKGRLPSAKLGWGPKGRLPSTHPLSDPMVVRAEEDGTTSIEDLDGGLAKRFQAGLRRTHLVLTPWHLSLMGRLLGKMGLEYVCRVEPKTAMSTEFDELRRWVRHGSTHLLWPVFWGSHGSVRELSTQIREGPDGPEYDVLCYQYWLGTIQGDHAFTFGIGTDIYLVCLSHRRPETYLGEAVKSASMTCLWHEDGSW